MHNRTIKNAAWIIGCRIIQAGLALIVTMMSARYLGPSGYGLINYASSLVSFFVPIMELGLNSTLVQELVSDPEHEGETMGTALAMTLISSVACIIGITAVSALLTGGEAEAIWICVLYSFMLIFRSLEMIQYWYQAKLLSKYSSLTTLAAYIVVAGYRIFLLVTGRSVYWFAVSQAIDFAIIAGVLLVIYSRISGSVLTVSAKRAAAMLERSKHFILSAMMITIFAQTDRVMLKMMIDEEAVGYYSAAVACTTMSNFVFVAIIGSAKPTILQSIQKEYKVFEEQYTLLYSVVVYLALLQSVAITLLADWMVQLLYGSSYTASVPILRLAVWYTTFSYIGSVRYLWVLAKNQQHLLWKVNLSGALLNVVLNALLIPHYGAMGAAAASLVTQIFTNVLIGFILKPLRENNRLLAKSLNPVPLLRYGIALLGKRNSY